MKTRILVKAHQLFKFLIRKCVLSDNYSTLNIPLSERSKCI